MVAIRASPYKKNRLREQDKLEEEIAGQMRAEQAEMDRIDEERDKEREQAEAIIQNYPRSAPEVERLRPERQKELDEAKDGLADAIQAQSVKLQQLVEAIKESTQIMMNPDWLLFKQAFALSLDFDNDDDEEEEEEEEEEGGEGVFDELTREALLIEAQTGGSEQLSEPERPGLSKRPRVCLPVLEEDDEMV
jgi:hypothetical protein